MNKDVQIKSNRYMRSDAEFNKLYPTEIQILAKRHWTPIYVTELTMDFLATDESKILDIGSGVGKFCLAGACYAPHAHFFGIEQRKYLVDHALAAQKSLGVDNASFINGNFTQLDLRSFDHFYFFNSFQENIDFEDKIDESIRYSEALYDYYNRFLYVGLQQVPKGTKVAAFHSFQEMPIEFDLVESRMNGDLNFWIKK